MNIAGGAYCFHSQIIRRCLAGGEPQCFILLRSTGSTPVDLASLCVHKKPCPLRKDRLRPMARHIATIMCWKSCLIEANGSCKRFPRIIVNVAITCNKINQLHVNSTKFFIFYLEKSKIDLYFVPRDTSIYFYIFYM